ncbi:putative F-box domain-containing protein [Helianthus anomalus]
MVHDLCEDLLIVEIFSRLPSKSLLRFRSVSKSLCACIGSPDFIRLHKLRSPPKKLLSDNPYVGITPVNGPSSLRKPFYHIFGSCNGIICLHEHCSRKRILCLWNPSIRRKVDGPFLGHCWVYGFGFDPIIDDYKLLRIDKDDYSSCVYTLKTRTWRKIASPTGKFLFVGDHLCRFNLFNGLLHWAVKKSTWIWVRKEYNNNTAASWSVAYKLDTNPFKRVLQITPNDELLCYSRSLQGDRSV